MKLLPLLLSILLAFIIIIIPIQSCDDYFDTKPVSPRFEPLIKSDTAPNIPKPQRIQRFYNAQSQRYAQIPRLDDKSNTVSRSMANSYSRQQR